MRLVMYIWPSIQHKFYPRRNLKMATNNYTMINDDDSAANQRIFDENMTYAATRKRQQELQRDLNMVRRNAQFMCFHRDEPNSPKRVTYLSDESLPKYVKDLAIIHSKTTVVCADADGCMSIFEGAQYTDKDVDDCAFQVHSMFEQMKWLTGDVDNFPGGSAAFNDFCNMLTAFDRMAAAYKGIMFQKNSGNQAKKNRNNGPKKGGYGVPTIYAR